MTKWPALLLLLAVSAASRAEEPSRAEVLAASCHACHGAHGQGSPALPTLRGRQDIGQQLQAFKSRAEASGPTHLMIRFARGLSEQDIDDLAAFYAQADPP